MKIILLTMQQLKNLIIRNKLFSSIFFISFLISSLCLIFMYGYYLDIMKTNIQKNAERRAVYVTFGQALDDYALIEHFLNQYKGDIERVCIYSEPLTVSDMGNKSTEGIVVSYIPKLENRFIDLGREFTPQEKINGDNLAIVGEGIIDADYTQELINKEIFINKIAYKVIGVIYQYNNPLNISAELPFNSFVKSRLRYNKISFVVSQSLYSSFKDIIQKDLYDKNIGQFRVEYAKVDKREEARFIERMIDALLFIGLAVVNVMMIYQYLVSIRRRDYAIMRIVGATENHTIASIFLELFLITFLTYLFSVLINHLVLIPIFRNIEINLVYKFKDYAANYFILFTISCIPLIPILYKNRFFSPLETRKESNL